MGEWKDGRMRADGRLGGWENGKMAIGAWGDGGTATRGWDNGRMGMGEWGWQDGNMRKQSEKTCHVKIWHVKLYRALARIIARHLWMGGFGEAPHPKMATVLGIETAAGTEKQARGECVAIPIKKLETCPVQIWHVKTWHVKIWHVKIDHVKIWYVKLCPADAIIGSIYILALATESPGPCTGEGRRRCRPLVFALDYSIICSPYF